MAQEEAKRDKDLVSYQSFAGVRNDIPAHRFSPNDLVSAINVDIDQSGAVSRRDWPLLEVAGDYHSVWSDNAVAYVVVGQALCRLDPNYSTHALLSLASNEPMSFHKVNDLVFFGNETDKGVIQNGAVRSWGMPVAPTPHVAVVPGILPAGEYQYAMTWIRTDGQESGCGVAGRITVPANSGLSFTLATPTDSTISIAQVYLSEPDGDVLYAALQVPSSQSSASYLGDTTELSYPLDKQFLSPPPAGHLVGYFKGRMYVASGDALYPSEPYAFELFDLRRHYAFDSKVTLFAPIDDEGVFIATQRSHAWLPGSGDDFNLVPKADYGAVPGAMAYIDAAMYGDHSLGARQLPMWISNQGICLGMPGGQINNITRSRYAFTAKGSGCALFKPESTQFIAAVTQ